MLMIAINRVVMTKILHIIQAWAKTLGWIKTTNEERELQKKRLDICLQCPHAKHSKTLEAIRGEITEVNVLKCDLCGCSLQEKTIIKNEKCPIEKW